MRLSALLVLAGSAACAACATRASEHGGAPTSERTIAFERITLSTEFTCEGATFGDLDRDGVNDVVAGPHWYAGPDFRTRHELYPPAAFDPRRYSDHFFDWVRDFDDDGWLDILVVGFPGKQAYWLRNPLGQPGESDSNAHWERFPIAERVDNESPTFVDLVGDPEPELVYMTGGRFGWAAPDPDDARAPWVFHALSPDLGLGPFVHGLGVGDVDGDERADVLWKDGWYQQPESLAGDPPWPFHPFSFTHEYGGAQMYVYDVDADGDGDVITSLAAHHFGLSWFEQVREGGEISFVEHRLMGDAPEESPHGLRFAEIHALDLGDVDGDGLLDIIAGKRWWSHSDTGDPEPGSRAVVYWFQLVRSEEGVDFVPHLADDQSGVGVQLVTGDVDADGLRDVVVGNKRGAFVLLQRRVTAEERATMAGRAPTLDFESGDLRGWTADGNAFALQPVRGDAPAARERESALQQGEYWIGGYERVGDDAKGTLTSNPIVVEQPFASFLIGGGTYTSTRFEILDAASGQTIFLSAGANTESMQRIVADLRAFVGERIVLRLVDENTEGWGHINFDDFRFHAERPAFEVPEGVTPILPFDEVPNAGLSPTHAARAMSVPDGFHVDLIAAEPDVHQPIALAIDDRGRLWVAEAFTYPNRAEGDRGLDDIVVFEDADHDGSFERRTVFMEGLNLVSGLEVGFGGVWIGAAPYLMFVPDRDGDLVPDGAPQILLDGWAFEDTHETLNAFQWGPDGWLYGCHGIFTYSNVGVPGSPADERTPINAGVWRYHPQRHEFEVFAFGTSNPWGVDFDARGQAFVTACVIPHLFHMVQGGRFHRQSGEHFGAYVFDDIETIADHRHYLGPDSHSANLRSNSVGGGHAHCGLVIYDGLQWPAEYRGGLFFENIHGNRVNHDVVERSGSGFVGSHEPDLLISNDAWFRGVAFELGPDGAVYLTDWYDEQACHLTDQEVWDRTNGRIYRVRYGEHPAARVDLAGASGAELAALALGEDGWYARRARRLLQERGPDTLDPEPLDRELAPTAAELTQLRAMWALHAGGVFDEGRARQQLSSPHEYARAWSIQLALEDHAVEPETLAALEDLARSDPSPVVRLYLASALQRLPVESRWTLAERLAAHAEDADDHNIPLVLWYGIEPLVAADADRALATFAHAPIPTVARFVARRAAADRALHPALVRALADPAHADVLGTMLAEAVIAVADQRSLPMPPGWTELYPQLTSSADPDVCESAGKLALAFGDPAALPELRASLAAPETGVTKRLEALEALVRFKDPTTVPLLFDLLDEAPMQGAAIRAFASFDDPAAAAAIVDRYAALGQDERRDALDTLSARASYATSLLDALEAERIPRTDLGAFVARKIESLNDAELAVRLEGLWGRVRPSAEEKTARIAELKATLTGGALLAADPSRGREVFARTCQQCHTLFGTGGDVGPELTGANRADLDYLLSNVIDPNAVVGKDYLATLVWTTGGRLVTGIQRASNDSAITLQSENETVVVAREEIDVLRLSDLSTMPEGLLATLAADEIAGLFAYLQSPGQVPLTATSESLASFFDGISLRGWSGNTACWSVEEGELVGRTDGLARNEFLLSDLVLSDFRLSIEVLLTDDQGNSGIQFRSVPHGSDGDVAGYQADIGPGWWGKLYEEHGRGVLSDRSGEPFVKKGEWNHYEIEAVGPRVRTWLNGQPCVDLEDGRGAKSGRIALQIHSGGPTEVRFRAPRLELLD
jgi:putative membrane-bound dehydrogenase-like protein